MVWSDIDASLTVSELIRSKSLTLYLVICDVHVHVRILLIFLGVSKGFRRFGS